MSFKAFFGDVWLCIGIKKLDFYDTAIIFVVSLGQSNMGLTMSHMADFYEKKGHGLTVPDRPISTISLPRAWDPERPRYHMTMETYVPT